jgi:tetratricopeptide (TPR) repeat protein
LKWKGEDFRHTVHGLRAYIYRVAGDRLLEKAELISALTLSPGDAGYLSSRMELYAELDDHESAISDASDILSNRRHRAFRNDALLVRALMYARIGRYDEAKLDLIALDAGCTTRLKNEIWTASKIINLLP